MGVGTKIWLFVFFVLAAGPFLAGALGDLLFNTFHIKRILGFNVEALLWAPILFFVSVPAVLVWGLIGLVGAFVASREEKFIQDRDNARKKKDTQ